ncbi:MAG: hypothetical protein IJT82_09425 [Schwartzia sp.]|nr:hypothetical protein [Schwartzia sp. (in: firmicutes)]
MFFIVDDQTMILYVVATFLVITAFIIMYREGRKRKKADEADREAFEREQEEEKKEREKKRKEHRKRRH